jgi:hypothetical protein
VRHRTGATADFREHRTGELRRIPLPRTPLNRAATREGPGGGGPGPDNHYLASLGQESADVDQLPFTLQWLNELALRVKDIAEAPDG